jgi:hypothetical protein
MNFFTLTFCNKRIELHTFLRLIYFILIVNFASSCSTSPNGGRRDEGKIIYDIEILGEDLDPFMMSMMPSQAEFFFKKEKTAMFLSSKGNLVRFAAFSDGETKHITQEIKLMNKRVKAEFDAREIFFYTDHPSFTLLETSYVDSMVGVLTHTDLVIYDEIEVKESELIYCKDIKVKNPNWYNIYNDIPYVLLQYEYDQFGFTLRLRAKHLEFLKISDDVFVSSDEYREISPEEFVEELRVIAESL